MKRRAFLFLSFAAVVLPYGLRVKVRERLSLDEIVRTTIANNSSLIADNITQNNALLARMNEH